MHALWQKCERFICHPVDHRQSPDFNCFIKCASGRCDTCRFPIKFYNRPRDSNDYNRTGRQTGGGTTITAVLDRRTLGMEWGRAGQRPQCLKFINDYMNSLPDPAKVPQVVCATVQWQRFVFRQLELQCAQFDGKFTVAMFWLS